MRVLSLVLALLVLAALRPAAAAEPLRAVMYKDPYCGCCAEYATYLRRNGIPVEVRETADMERIKRLAGVPADLASCHTMTLGAYVIEGHVPIEAIHELLDRQPRVRGISLPGMPTGSPGMSGPKEGPFTVYTVSDRPARFMVE